MGMSREILDLVEEDVQVARQISGNAAVRFW